MATVPQTTHYAEALDSLVRAIGKHRSTGPPRETARELLRYDHPGHSQLVGIDDGGGNVYLYHVEGRYVVVVAFDGNGLADGGPEIASFRREGSIHGWIDRKGSSLGWLHPRYR